MRSVVVRTTANGIEHGLIRSFPNEDRTDGFQHMKPDIKEKCLKEQKENAQIVTMMYKNREEGGYLEMPFNLGGGYPIEYWRFIDNYVYDLPKGLVKQVKAQYRVEREKDDGIDDTKKLQGFNNAKVNERIVGKSREHDFFPVGDF